MTRFSQADYLRLSLFSIGCVLSLAGFLDSASALLLGAALALSIGHNFGAQLKKITKKLLALSIIGLGASMNLIVVTQTGLAGLAYTAVGITSILVFGVLLGRVLSVHREITWLVSMGTAICGGSAIAALAPVIRAQDHNVSVALAVVFALNALALILFPTIGTYMGLSQEAFGLWSALAIHDTSSVVGVSLQYGEEALEVATTVKLARALWIIPVVLAIHFIFVTRNTKDGEDTEKVSPQFPFFILGFIMMAAIFTYMPSLQPVGDLIAISARRVLIFVMFLIGAALTRDVLRGVGLKPLLLGVILWVITAAVSLACIRAGWVIL